jgi:hypothetical protein
LTHPSKGRVLLSYRAFQTTCTLQIYIFLISKYFVDIGNLASQVPILVNCLNYLLCNVLSKYTLYSHVQCSPQHSHHCIGLLIGLCNLRNFLSSLPSHLEAQGNSIPNKSSLNCFQLAPARRSFSNNLFPNLARLRACQPPTRADKPSTCPLQHF